MGCRVSIKFRFPYPAGEARWGMAGAWRGLLNPKMAWRP